jgi:hypothetical protein
VEKNKPTPDQALHDERPPQAVPGPGGVLAQAGLSLPLRVATLHARAPMRQFCQPCQRRLLAQVAPVDFLVSVRTGHGTLAHEPAHRSGAVPHGTLHPHREKLLRPWPFASPPPTDRLPCRRGLCANQSIGSVQGSDLRRMRLDARTPRLARGGKGAGRRLGHLGGHPPPEVPMHAANAMDLSLDQAIEKGGCPLGPVAIAAIGDDQIEGDPVVARLINQRQGELRLGLERHAGRDVRLLAPPGIVDPRLRQVDLAIHRPGEGGVAVGRGDHDLPVRALAQDAAILGSHTHGVRAFAGESGLIDHHCPISRDRPRDHRLHPLPVERWPIPGGLRQQAIDRRVREVGHGRGQPRAALPVNLRQQSGGPTFESLKALIPLEERAKRQEKLPQFRNGVGRHLHLHPRFPPSISLPERRSTSTKFVAK